MKKVRLSVAAALAMVLLLAAFPATVGAWYYVTECSQFQVVGTGLIRITGPSTVDVKAESLYDGYQSGDPTSYFEHALVGATSCSTSNPDWETSWGVAFEDDSNYECSVMTGTMTAWYQFGGSQPSNCQWTSGSNSSDTYVLNTCTSGDGDIYHLSRRPRAQLSNYCTTTTVYQRSRLSLQTDFGSNVDDACVRAWNSDDGC